MSRTVQRWSNYFIKSRLVERPLVFCSVHVGVSSERQLPQQIRDLIDSQASEEPEGRSREVSPEQVHACAASQKAMNSEAERTKTKAQGPVPLEPASKDVSLTSSPTQSRTKAALKRQRGSDDAAVWQSPSSKFRGVTRHKRSGRWEAHIWLGKGTNKQIYLGGYEGEELAAEAYDVVSIKAKGWSAVTNFSKERYMGLQEVIDCCTMDELIAAIKRGSQAFSRGFSSYRGVSRHFSGRYEARLGFAGGKHMYIGVFAEELNAAKAYDECAVRLKGRQAATNFLVANYVRQLTEHELKQLETKKPEVFHALCCHACTKHALTEFHDRELPTANPLCTSVNVPDGPAAVFPCNNETPEGLPHSRLAEVVPAAWKEFSAVASGVLGMHTPTAVMPPLPTPEEIEIPDSNSSTWGVSEGTLQEWLKCGYPDKEIYALDRVLSRIKAKQDQSGDDKAKKSMQDVTDRRRSTSSLQQSLSFSNMMMMPGETEIRRPAVAPDNSAPNGVHVAATASAFESTQAASLQVGAATAGAAAGMSGAKPYRTPPFGRSSWSALPNTLDAIMQSASSKPCKPFPRSRKVGDVGSTVVTPVVTAPMHAHKRLPQFLSLPAHNTATAAAGVVTDVFSNNKELDEIASQLQGSLEEKVEVIAAHAAAQAVRTQISLILQNDVFANACRTLGNQEVLNPPSQGSPSAQVHTSNKAPHENRTRRGNPTSISEISRASDPSRFPANSPGAHVGSDFATPAAFPRQKSAFKPVRNPVSIGVQLPMPRHASSGFPCDVPSSPPVDTSAEVSTGVASAAHACAVPQLPIDISLCPSEHGDDTVGRHASLDTGSHRDTALTGFHDFTSCMPPLQVLQAEADATPLAFQQHQLPQQQLPQQHPHMMTPTSPMIPTAPAVPASSQMQAQRVQMWQQPPSLVPVFIPSFPPTGINSLHLWTPATSAPESAPALVPASHP